MASSRNTWILAGVVAAAIVGVILITQLGERQSAGRLSETDVPAVGDAGAPLTVYLFEDFQCPFCARFETEGGADHLRETWVETGKVRVVAKHLTFLDRISPGGRDSTNAAEASLCVFDQAPLDWPEWNRLVYENQGQEGSGWASPQFLRGLTEAWGGVDMGRYDACLAGGGPDLDGILQQNAKDADKAGVRSTPTLLVASRAVNALDTAAVDAAIQEALDA